MNITFCAITPGRFKCSAKRCGADALVRVNASNCCGEHAANLLRAEYAAAVGTLATIIADANAPTYVNARGETVQRLTNQAGPHGEPRSVELNTVTGKRILIAADDLPRGGP